MNYDKIGEFIKEKRKEKNLTQKELAEKLNVTDKAISKWERGQGCPDVSILEILSKELGCSILELLKGREIENEVIPVTEADDYIKESMAIEKEGIKENIKKVVNTTISFTLIFIILLLGYLNVVQYLYVIEKEEYKVDWYERKKIEEKKDILEKNIEIMKMNQGNYSKEDRDELLRILTKNYENLQKEKVYQHIMEKKPLSYARNELQIIGMGRYLYDEMNTMKEIIQKYDSNISNNMFFEFTFYYNVLDNEITVREMTTYKYRLTKSKDSGEALYGINNMEIMSLIQDVNRDITRLAYLSELIIEVGDIHE